MKMAKVMKCEVSDCVYNMDNCCHTMAITVGDGNNPMCDTFCHSTVKGGDVADLAGVGACKVSACKHNTKFECESSGISIDYQDLNPNCMTFETK